VVAYGQHLLVEAHHVAMLDGIRLAQHLRPVLRGTKARFPQLSYQFARAAFIRNEALPNMFSEPNG
jgi:hypothetical protein